MIELWRLTDEEKRYLNERGGNVAKSQEAKKQAYIKAGGIILNPDALDDLYEVLKEARTWKDAIGTQFPLYMFDKMDEALARAEMK